MPSRWALTRAWVEGAAAAYDLAKRVGKNEEIRRQVVVHGMRFCLQTQFDSYGSTFFLPVPKEAMGGYRYTIGPLRLRNDYSYHAMAGAFGKLADLSGDDDAAITLYERARRVKPMRTNVLVNLGRTEGILPRQEQVFNENYRAGDRIVGVNGFPSGPNAVVLRAGGRLQGSFGTGGEALGPFTASRANGVTLMPNGRIVLSGVDNASNVIAVLDQETTGARALQTLTQFSPILDPKPVPYAVTLVPGPAA